MVLARIAAAGLICLAMIFGTVSPARAWFGSGSEEKNRQFDSLATMADAMAKEMKEGHAGMGLRLYLDREDIREDQELRCVPFNGMLVNELERAFSRAGFTFEGRSIDKADYLLTASYHRTAGGVAVYLKLKSATNDAYRSLKGNYEVALERLPRECFIENLDGKLARLAQKVSRGWQRSVSLSVFVAPVVEARRKYSSPFSDYATRKLKSSLSETPYFRIVEAKPALQRAATRSVATHADLAASDGILTGADAVLEGAYLRGGEQISLSATLKDTGGKVLAAVEETIPLGIITYPLENDAADALAQFADTEHEKTGEVRISTVKGGSYQVFREGETVSFTLQVSRPLYVYVYDINPGGEVSLLYPKQGEKEQPRQPGIIYTIPEESDSWEIKVEPPYGKDLVKVFASDRRLPVPVISGSVASRSFSNGTRALKQVDKVRQELSGQNIINGRDLVDWYKGTAFRMGAALQESTVYVETKGK